jgi:hypothetical protein
MNHSMCVFVPTLCGLNLILTSHDDPGASDIPWLQVENETSKEPGGNCFEVILAEAELPAGLLSVTVDAALKWPICTYRTRSRSATASAMPESAWELASG